MKVLQLTATQFIREMSTGRNHPLLLGCEDDSGDAFEVVVKFRGREMTGKAQCAELISAMLADDLGLQIPQAAIVSVPPGFEAIIPRKATVDLVKGSEGLNFGSVHLGPGFTTWPPDRAPHGAQRDQAADIFAFDTLLQNPDRRATTPNLWVRSDRIGVLDHELAFGFLSVPIIGGAPKPWEGAQQPNAFRFLEKHIFYAALRGGRMDLGPLQEKLSLLTDQCIRGYIEAAPAEWRGEDGFCERVGDYVREAAVERTALMDFVKHILR